MEGAMLNLPGRLDVLLRRHRSILPKGAEHEIPLIKRDLEEIISILHGQSEPKVLEDHANDASMVRRCWMKEVRELSYDMEDCIDQYEDCVEQYEHAATAGYGSRSNNIRRRKFRGKTPWVPEKLKQRLWMANKIREFSLRVQEAIQRYAAMYKNDLSGIASTASTTICDVSSSSPSHPAPGGKRGYVGIDAAMNKIEDWLTDVEHKKLKVVSIVGVGGVGKTTLADELYRKLRRQFECRAFVRTSQKPDMRRILISMLSQVCPQQPPDNWKVHSLISSIRTHLQHKRYLIIIDDLWAASTWDIIKCTLPDGDSCSRILTTTEIEDLALQSCSYDSKYIFNMKPLGEDDSRSLFFNIVFGSCSNCPPELSEVSYDIVRKCGGLPLAVVTIASLLASQLDKQEQWDYINKTLGYSLMANPNLEGMKQLLNLCYNNLPQHLKACMLYLSMYQEDTIIWKDDLVNQWIAEGFICAIEEHDKEEVSRSYFDELVARKIIQPVHINDNGEVLSCVVHRMVLNLITYMSIDENFIIAIDHSQATTRLADMVRRLSIHFGNVEDATPPTNMRLSQVRTLAFSGVLNWMSSIIGFRLLKVLILHFWGDEDNISFDLTKITELVRLRYLKVTSNVTLELPTKMQGLQYLETLKIDGKICAVPSDIIHLPGLLHLSLPAGTNLPNGIAHMSSLRTLGYFDLSCNSEENLQSLGQLTNLQDLQLAYSAVHSDILKNNMQWVGSILGKHSNLKSITLSRPCSDANTQHVDSATSTRITMDGWSSVSSAPVLQNLELLPCVFIFSSLPNWIGQLRNLCILKIGIREVTNNDIVVLGVLPKLTVLSLYVHTMPAEKIVFDNLGFSILKYFKFRCSAAWMKFEAGAMPNLRKLKLGFDVHRADQHDTIPVGIKYLSGLEEISAKIRVACTADDLCRRFAESALTNVMRMHPGRPTVNIRFVDWTFDGKDDGNAGTQEEESRTQQKQHHIVKGSSTEKSAVLEKDPEGEADKYGESSKVEVEEAGPVAVDKVFVAVAADVKHGESTLQWTLQNLAKDGTKVVIAHVHCPAQIIPIMGAKIHYTKMNPKQVSDYRNKEREMAQEKLDKYLLICRKLKVSCEKLIIEEEDIAKGLEDLIALHGITKLVMGAAADKHYSRMMSTPKSKKALRILEAADPSCKIWFTCKGHLICTREANTTVPAVPPFKFRRPEKPCRYYSSRIAGLPMLQPMYEPDDDHSASRRELEFRLEALREAEDLKKEEYEESTKRRHAEKDLLSALQKVKELEDLCQKEIMRRKIIERVLQNQIKATVMVHNRLYGAEEQKLIMMHRITEMQAVVKEHEKKLAQSKYLEKEELYTEFSSSELEQASRLFNEELMIGAGGFGSVYKGTLRNTTVAIKLLDQHSMQGKLEEFDQEIAVLSRVRHPNLVTLIGVCRESFGLVYEFLPEGSLEERLAHLNNNKPPLTWQVRTKIIYEMCSALTFLHSNKPRPIVHGDLKPANILLDANLVSKLGDLGIYQMLMQSKTAIATTLNRTTTPKGTFAYMDPEFLTTGELTPRSDVYSLGIIILRLLTGKPPQRIAEVVEDAIESGELGSILDPSAGSWPLVQANQLAQLGLRCAAMSSRSRPDLAGDGWKVVESLMSMTTGRPPSFVAPPLPAYFLCPIIQEVMSDPHIAADGFTYEAEAIRGWLARGHDTSPITNLKLEHRELIPNRALRSAILEWQKQCQQQ